MAFDKKLLPEGAITLPEFMAKHDPEEIENYRVSYLLPDGTPLEYEDRRLEGIEVELIGWGGKCLELRDNHSRALLSTSTHDWGATTGWGDKVSREMADDSVIAVLDYHKPSPVGKSAREWLEIEGFQPLWFEGARFKGFEGRLTRDSQLNFSAAQAVGWSSIETNAELEEDWLGKVRDPWRDNHLLYLTPENEAKALALLGSRKPERISKPADEWLAIEGFDPLWFEGARFEGREGVLTLDAPAKAPRRPFGWNSTISGEVRDWHGSVRNPWLDGVHLHLTPENEAKALALPGASDEDWRERREDGLGASEIEDDEQHELLVQKSVTEWMNEEYFSPWMLEGARFPTSTGWEAELVLHSSNQYLGGPTAWNARRVSTGELADWREVEALFSPNLTNEALNAVCIRKTNYHALLRAQGKMPWAP